MYIVFAIFAFLIMIGGGLIFVSSHNTPNSRMVSLTGVGIIAMGLVFVMGYIVYKAMYVY